jgi:hypothetical protein
MNNLAILSIVRGGEDIEVEVHRDDTGKTFALAYAGGFNIDDEISLSPAEEDDAQALFANRDDNFDGDEDAVSSFSRRCWSAARGREDEERFDVSFLLA